MGSEGGSVKRDEEGGTLCGIETLCKLLQNSELGVYFQVEQNFRIRKLFRKKGTKCEE